MKRFYIIICIFASILLALPALSKAAGEVLLAQDLSGKVLRFHILANSDSEEDQAQKLLVRDAVGEYINILLSDSTSLSSTEAVISSHLSEITDCAADTLKENGSTASVSATLAPSYFPVRTYGDYTFPAGIYQSLIIRIGNAKGHNWWCVMYPNLCFTDGIYEEPSGDSDTDAALTDAVGTKDFQGLTNNGHLTFRFKYLTLLNQLLE
jgi:stage II sporulation protein R